MDEKSLAESYDIEVQIAPSFTDVLTAEPWQALAERTLRHEDRPGQLTLVITDDKGIQELNRDFLGKDAPTDVLAFGTQEDSEPFVSAPEVELYLGDVIVSYPRAVAQAKELGHSLQEELSLLIVHGILHLLGYDHATQTDKAIMWARQEAILNK